MRKLLLLSVAGLVVGVAATVGFVLAGNDDDDGATPPTTPTTPGRPATTRVTPAVAPAAASPDGSYHPPAAIADDCSRAVDAELNGWMASVPDGSTIVFGARKCYGHDGSLVLVDRAGLTVDGNGSTFKALTRSEKDRSSWQLIGGRDITIKNTVVRGALPERKYHKGFEWQHAYDIRGTVGVKLEKVEGYNVFGDFVYAGTDPRQTSRSAPPARDVAVTGAHFEVAGRQGVALVNVDGFSIEDSYIGDVSLTGIDVEPDFPTQVVRDVRVAGNTFGYLGHLMFASVGQGGDPNQGGFVITGNVMKGAASTCLPPILVRGSGRYTRSGYTITDNQLLARGVGMRLLYAKDVDISGNRVEHSGDGCSPLGVQVVGSQGVRIVDNRFIGVDDVVRADRRSTVSESGNSTSASG